MDVSSQHHARGQSSGTPADARARRLALRRTIAAVLMIAGLGVGVVVTRALWQGMSALAAGDAAMARGDTHEAVERWRRAARWYLPGAAHVTLAYDRLETTALQAQAQGDKNTALAAWRGVRASILATRSFYTPHAHRLEPASERIAALMAELEAADQASASREERAEWHYELLRRDPAPSVFWSVVALLGFAVWLGGGLLFALRGVTRDDVLVPRTAMYAGVMVASGLLVWMMGLYLA
jgi:hypothetical protein